MKFDKASLQKAGMPKKGAKDPMLEDADLFAEAEAEGEEPAMEAKEMALEDEKSPLADLSDDELLEELKKRGFEVEDNEDMAKLPEEPSDSKPPTKIVGTNNIA
jgi:hypothetical protein